MALTQQQRSHKPKFHTIFSKPTPFDFQQKQQTQISLFFVDPTNPNSTRSSANPRPLIFSKNNKPKSLCFLSSWVYGFLFLCFLSSCFGFLFDLFAFLSSLVSVLGSSFSAFLSSLIFVFCLFACVWCFMIFGFCCKTRVSQTRFLRNFHTNRVCDSRFVILLNSFKTLLTNEIV